MARTCVWLDNNPTERAFGGPVVGRRNHFGSKSRRGTDAAAILYTLVQTAKASGVSPSAYTARQQQQDCLFTDGDRTEAGCNSHGLRKFRDDADKAPLLTSRSIARQQLV